SVHYSLQCAIERLKRGSYLPLQIAVHDGGLRSGLDGHRGTFCDGLTPSLAGQPIPSPTSERAYRDHPISPPCGGSRRGRRADVVGGAAKIFAASTRVVDDAHWDCRYRGEAPEIDATCPQEIRKARWYGADKLILLQCKKLCERPSPPARLTPENTEDHRRYHAEQASSSAFANPAKCAKTAGQLANPATAKQRLQSAVSQIGQLS